MKFNKFSEQWMNDSVNLKFSKFVIVALLCVIVWGQFQLYQSSKKMRTIIIPSHLNQKIEISDTYADDLYLRTMVGYMVNLIYSFTPYNIKNRYTEFLRYIPSSSIETIKDELNKKIEKNVSLGLSQQFYSEEFYILPNREILIGGKITPIVAGKVIGSGADNKVFLKVKYSLNSDGIQVETMEDVPENIFRSTVIKTKNDTK